MDKKNEEHYNVWWRQCSNLYEKINSGNGCERDELDYENMRCNRLYDFSLDGQKFLSMNKKNWLIERNE